MEHKLTTVSNPTGTRGVVSREGQNTHRLLAEKSHFDEREVTAIAVLFQATTIYFPDMEIQLNTQTEPGPRPQMESKTNPLSAGIEKGEQDFWGGR